MRWEPTMASSFTSTNALRKLKSDIKSIHMRYLHEDKSSHKIKYQNILQNYLRNYLSIEDPKKKFIFPKTAEILWCSVERENFHALKAANAWLAISTYANNLFLQPWRKEYHEIKLYSGFYKHQIESCLDGAYAMLELMGYRQIGYRMVLELPLNEEYLIKTSLDAFAAMCECQILFNVYEKVSEYISNLSWADILQIRESNAGTAEETVYTILSLSQYPSSCCRCMYSYSSNYQHNYPKYQESISKIQTCVPMNSYCVDRYSNQPAAPYSHLTNGRYPGVPIAKLIDVDESFDIGYSHHHRKVNANRWPNSDCYSKYENNFTSDSNNSFEEDSYRDRFCVVASRRNGDRANSAENLDYVYRRLGKKDHWSETSEPDPRLSVHSYPRISSRTNANTISETLNNLKLSPNADLNVSNFEDELNSHQRSNVTRKCSSNSIEHERQSRSHSGRVATEKYSRSTGKQSPTWECSACTYFNSLKNDVCVMCSKSRQVNEETPLTSGGKQCNVCTLVNPKNAIKCEACESPLENSSTYV